MEAPPVSRLAALLAKRKAELEAQKAKEASEAEPVLQKPLVSDEDELESRAHLLEAEARALRSKLDSAKSLESKVASLELELQSERASVSNARSGLEHSAAQLAEARRIIDEKEKEAEVLKRNRELKEKEASDAKDTITRLQKELETMNSDMHASSALANSSQSEETRFRIQMVAFEKERVELKKNVDWLNSELERKSLESSAFRESKTAEVALLSKTVETLTQEKDTLEQKSAALIEKTNANETRISELISKLEHSESRLIQHEKSFKTELNMQESLANLYKSKSEEYAQRMQECLETAHKAQDEIRQAIQARLELESSVRDLKRDLESRDEKIDELNSTVETLRQRGGENATVTNV
ncbi:hypothetical protein BDR26DRAFT_522882 [Obelidium mucronatum]|nr:hypothetical protein BDR26DRAFT_522882 [Obelidium mucronatum]